MNTCNSARWRRIYLSLSIALMIFIFLQSALPADLSSEESSFLVDLLLRYIQADPDLLTFLIRKMAHFSEYMALGFCLAMTLRFCRDSRSRQPGTDAPWPASLPAEISPENRPLFMLPPLPAQAGRSAWIIGTAYAVTDEIHQHFVPGRSCELRDICIDSAGVLCGVLITLLLHRRTATANA